MLHNNIIKLVTFIWCVLTVVSCTNEDWGEGNNGPTVPEGLPVTLKLDIGTPDVPVVETKALENDNNTFGSINDLAVLVFDENGQNPIVTYVPNLGGVTAKDGISFDAKTGMRKIYVLTNVGSAKDAKKYATESDLLSTKIASEEPFGDEQMLGYAASSFEESKKMFEAGKAMTPVKIEGDISLKARIFPPYSKITFKITSDLPNMDQVYLNIHSATVRRVPKAYTLRSLSGKGDDRFTNADISDREISVDIKEAQSQEGFSFITYENKQGIHDSKGPAYKSPGIEVPETSTGINYNEWFEKWNALPCTYIEVKGKYSIVTGTNTVKAGDIYYRFFLGEDNFSNFNICRNTNYIVTLKFSLDAGYGELKHEWRVHAKLDEATFIPEGDLVIDGFPAGIGYVPFYVANATSGIIQLNTETSTSNMTMYFDQGGSWGTSSAADFKGFSCAANSMTEFSVAPNDGGVLGQRGYGGSYSYADNLDKRDQVASGEIYNTRVYTISYTTSGHTEESKLIVKELPLLLLTESYDIYSSQTTYARRVDGAYLSRSTVEGNYDYYPRNEYFTRATDKIRAQRICTGTVNYSDKYGATSIQVGNLKSFLPTRSEIDKILQLEKANPLKNAKYWTMDGLYDITTKQIVANGEGYIRCVARGV